MLSISGLSQTGYVSLDDTLHGGEAPQLRGRLERFGALGKVNLGSPIVKIAAVALIGLGIASIATGFGIFGGVFLICAGATLLGGSIETNVRDTAALGMSRLNIVTYNTGTNINDYGLLCRYNDSQATEENYRTSQARTAAFFRDLAQRHQLDALMLQEISGAAPLLEALRQEGFVICKKGELNRFGAPIDDCAIALNPKRFQVMQVAFAHIDVENVPIVLAKDKHSKHTFMFASAHVPGMNLVDRSKAKEQAEIGDAFVARLIAALREIPTGQSAVIQIIGADMNRNPERWNPPFQLLTQQGFETHRTGQTTEVFPVQTEYPERELDFVFTAVTRPPVSRLERSLGIPPKLPRVVANKVSTLMDFGATDGVPDNASDHRPVTARFSFF